MIWVGNTFVTIGSIEHVRWDVSLFHSTILYQFKNKTVVHLYQFAIHYWVEAETKQTRDDTLVSDICESNY